MSMSGNRTEGPEWSHISGHKKLNLLVITTIFSLLLPSNKYFFGLYLYHLNFAGIKAQTLQHQLPAITDILETQSVNPKNPCG